MAHETILHRFAGRHPEITVRIFGYFFHRLARLLGENTVKPFSHLQDFFGFNGELGLQYRGRLDASRKETGPPDLRRDLFEAMKQVAETGRGPAEQVPSMGCSIKWKAA